MVKFFRFLVVMTAIITAFGSCQKDEQVIPAKEEALNNDEVILMDDNFDFSKTITVFDETKENSVELLITSTNEKLIDYYLEVYDINLVIDTPLGTATLYKESKKGTSKANEAQMEEFPDDCIAFEVNTKKLKMKSSTYILKIEKKNELLKSYPYPPTTYYTLYKFDKGDNGKVWYFPDDTYNDELLYKWGYTNSWIASWNFDSYWNYLWGFDAVDSPMVLYHPLNNMGYYRLGIAMYYDDAKYFYPMSY